MRNNTKKGFTLVELLVVIAILAILATVSVVGYTSYIQGAAVRVDKDLATQLNHFLAAYQVNNPVEITEDNCWEVTQELLEQAGIEELNPQSAQYHHHFYYNLEKDEYVLLPDSEAIDSAAGFEHIIGLFMRAFGADLDETPKFAVRPGNCFTVENKYFIVDSTGDLVDVLRGFYDFTSFEGDSTYHKFQSFVEKIHGSNVQPLKDMLNKCVFVTNEGNFVDDVNAAHDTLIFHEGATAISSIKTDETGKPATIGEDGVYLLVLSEDTRIELPAGISLPTNSLNIGFAEGKTPNVTVVIDAKQWSEVKEYVDADFTKSNVAVELGGVKYEIYVNDVCEYTTDETKGAVRDHLKYNNSMTDFNIKLSNDEADNLIANAGENAGTIAWEKKTFKLELTNITGKKNDGSAISNTQVKWTSLTEGVTVDQSGNVTVGASVPSNIDEIKIYVEALISEEGYTAEGTPEGVTKTFANATFTIKVGAIDKNTVLIGGSKYDSSTTYTVNHTLGESDNIITLNNSLGYINYDKNNALIEIDDGFTVTSNNTDVATYANGQITVLKAGTATISVKFDVYTSFNYDIVLTVTEPAIDLGSLNIQIRDGAQYKYLGGQSITLSDIFVITEGSLPAGTKVVVFDGEGNPDATLADRDKLSNNSSNSIYINDSNYTLDVNNVNATGKTVTTLEATDIKLAGAKESGDKIVIALFANGQRVSPDFAIYIVDAVNVRDYAGLKANIANNSVVLLNNITDMPEGATEYLVIPTGKTLYGNLFDIDVKNGITTLTDGKNAVVNVSGKLQDARVLGAIYSKFAFTVDSPFGASTVSSNGGTIENCYITHGRSPLRVDGGTVTVEDTVFFGGRYSNIDIVGGTLKIKGKVTTVQQELTADDGTKVIGLGISAWFNDATKTIQYADANAELIQYNFVNENASLPVLTVGDIADQYKDIIGGLSTETLLDLGSLFTNMFTNPDFESFVFDKNTDNKYIHAGMVAIDKYNIKFIFSRSHNGFSNDVHYYGGNKTPAGSNTALPAGGGDTVTLRLTPTVTEENVKITLNYTKLRSAASWQIISPASFTQVSNTSSNRTIEFTTNFVAGQPVDIVFQVKDGRAVTGAMRMLNSIVVKTSEGATSQSLSTMQLYTTDANGNPVHLEQLNNYGHIVYNFATPSMMKSAAESFEIFHQNGIHFQEMPVDVRGYNSTSDYSNARFTEYKTMGNYYAENGAGAIFDENGKLVTYTEYLASQSSN